MTMVERDVGLAAELVDMMAADQAVWVPVLQAMTEPEHADAFERRYCESNQWDMRTYTEWEIGALDVVLRYRNVHATNAARLRSIVDAVGWPSRSLVGEDAADAAWLLLQHLGDSAFQRKCLEFMKALPAPERDLKHYAFTFDLLCKVEGRLPKFGTMGPDVEDREGLDQLRAEYDLPLLSLQEDERARGHVVMPCGIGRRTEGFGWPHRERE